MTEDVATDGQVATSGTAGTGRHRVLVIGGGFGGLNVARGLDGAPVEVTLVDRTNHHLFQPLLYQVAAASKRSSRSTPRTSISAAAASTCFGAARDPEPAGWALTPSAFGSSRPGWPSVRCSASQRARRSSARSSN